MAVEDWYLYKAQQCVRLADASTDARKRTWLNEEAEMWRGLARDLARQALSEARS